TTSNDNDFAADILVASNAAFNVKGNWLMKGGAHRIASVQTSGNWGNANIGYFVNNTASSIDSSAVLSLGNPGAAGNLTLCVGYGGVGNVLTVDGGLVTNVANLYVGIATANGNQLIITNGGQVFSGNSGAATPQMLIGNNAVNTNNGVIVTGSGSRWDTGTRNVVISQARASNFGNYLRVADGGMVTNVGGLTVSSGGQNSYVSITNGGVVFSASGYIGNAAGASGNWGYVGGNNALWNLGRGALVIGNNSAATNNTLTLAMGGSVTNVSAITLGGVNSVLTFNGGLLAAGTNGYLIATNGTAVNPAVFVQAGGAIIDSGAFTVTNQLPMLGDPASTNGGLTKLGGGTLVLLGASTYSGTNTVSEGTLEVAGAGELGSGSTLKIAPGATVKLSANATVNALYFGDFLQAGGTWGAPGTAGASHTRDSFTGTGVLTVTTGAPPGGTLILLF
ncbi:MAG: autotransporter-associated beta strand repeat-containing protein, partial [bacterium]